MGNYVTRECVWQDRIRLEIMCRERSVFGYGEFRKYRK